MKPDVFSKMVNDEIIPRLMKIQHTKGMSYSGNEDKLGNFKRIAKKVEPMIRAGTDPIAIVWYVYFSKHLDSLDSFLRREYKDSESIEGRIDDLINYLMLLHGILRDK